MQEHRTTRRFSRDHELGIAILSVVVQHLLKSIPVVGSLFELSFAVLKVVKEEIERSENRSISNGDMSQALNSVTVDDATRTVDSCMAAPEAVVATSNLTPEQVAAVRERLIGLPSEITSLLSRIAADERDDVRRNLQLKEARRDQDLSRYKANLREALADRQLQSALGWAEKVLHISPCDEESLAAEAFLFRRVGEGSSFLQFCAFCFVTGAFLFGGGVCLAIGLHSSWLFVGMALLWPIPAIMAFCLGFWLWSDNDSGLVRRITLLRAMPRYARKSLPWFLLACAIGFTVAGVVFAVAGFMML